MGLGQGIPLTKDYLKLLSSDLFLQLESFSNNFLKINKEALSNYHLIKDPLHQIFRQWEYPFCYCSVEHYLESNKAKEEKVNILDAGSGCTFFPYYLCYSFPRSTVCCCDIDTRLTSFFRRINKNMSTDVDFQVCNIRHLGYEDNSFDVVYCISVLEHTTDYEFIIKEFKRVLKPKGLLVISFDISFDNRRDISIDAAQDLLQNLDSEFESTSTANPKELLKATQEPGILTTDFARKFSKRLLPWKLGWKTVIYEIMRWKIPKKPFWSLTVFCSTWRNGKYEL